MYGRDVTVLRLVCLSTIRRALASLALGLTAFAWSMPTAASARVEGAQVIAIVNQQRAANGIPAIATNDQSYAGWCPNEQAPLSKEETGRASASTDSWTATETPYSTAPLHQQILYSPAAQIAGDVFRNGHDCFGIGEMLGQELSPASSPTFYAFVNERGPLHAVTAELADELPTTPQQEVGFPLEHRTGPQIILWALGLGLDPVASAPALTTASGAVVPDVRIAPGARDAVLVAPVLKPGTHYVLSIQWQSQLLRSAARRRCARAGQGSSGHTDR